MPKLFRPSHRAGAGQPGRRGTSGRGGGRVSWVEAPAEWRGTTVQICGLWPWGTGSSTPVVGVPMGHHIYSGTTVSFDPISWFTRTSLINTPSVFILGEPGMGKSTAVRRMVLGLAAQNVTPLILGDLKPDYAALVAALGGQVIRVGPGLDHINPLDVGPWQGLADRVDARTRDQVRAGIIDRRLNMVLALTTLIRGTPMNSDESTILAAAIRHLTDTEHAVGRQPILSDVLRVVQNPPPLVLAVTLWTDTDDLSGYHAETAPLQRTLMALLNGALGSTFDGPTTTSIDVDTPAVCVDISGISETDTLRTAATLLSTWSYGFAVTDAAHMLADQGLAPPRTFMTVLDEMWRVLRAHKHLIDRTDALTRLNRQKGTGIAYITHGMSDLEAVGSEEDKAKARGFADRSAVLMIGASTGAELDAISRVRQLSRAERREILSWTAPDSWNTTGRNDAAGRGNFLIKVGSRPGIPVHLAPTSLELPLGNTDFRWDMSARGGAGR